MHHRIDGILVAVSALDYLEESLVSVFCMYDPDYKFLSLGHVTAV